MADPIQDGSGNNLVITELRQGDNYIPFGAKDKDIQMYNSNDEIAGSLHDFFQEWQAFKTIWNDFIANGKFMQYNTETPISNNVKLLFEINNNIMDETENSESGD